MIVDRTSRQIAFYDPGLGTGMLNELIIVSWF